MSKLQPHFVTPYCQAVKSTFPTILMVYEVYDYSIFLPKGPKMADIGHLGYGFVT